MINIQNTQSFRHFSKHLFIVSKVFVERNKARQEVAAHLQKMRKSIIRMNLSYTDIDRLKDKVENLINWERKYAKFFKPEDKETQELKNRINALEQELRNEKLEKQAIMAQNNERINQLSESLNSIKKQMNILHLEKAKRHHRLKALEQKIRGKVDVHRYYHT